MKCSLGGIVLALGAICTGCSVPSGNVDPATNTEDVVVAVLGYNSCYRLVTGEYVGGFTANTNVVNSRGFMFYVLSPTNHVGKLLYSHHDGPLAAGYPAKIYEIGKRYRFRVEEKYLLEVLDSGCGCVAGGNNEPVEVRPSPSELRSMIEEWNQEYDRTAKYRASFQRRWSASLDPLSPPKKSGGGVSPEEVLESYDQRLSNIDKERAKVKSLLETLEGGEKPQPAAGDYRLEDKAKSQR